MKIRGFNNPIFSALDFDNFPSSVANFPAALTINGITVNPTLRYKGGDATASIWPAWGYGSTLAITATGGPAPSYNQGSPLLGSVDDSVFCSAVANSLCYLAGGTTGLAVGTDDFVLELVANCPDSTGVDHYLLSERTAGDVGFQLESVNNSLLVWVADSGGGTYCVPAATITAGSWFHLMVFGNRDEASTNGFKYYVNGVAAGGTDISSRPGTLSGAAFCLGGFRGLAGGGNTIAFCAGYHYPAWHRAGTAGPAEWAIIAATRFAQLCGVYPQVATGTALPSAVTRTTAGYLDKIEADGTTKLYYMGPNFPRVCSKKDIYGITQKGYLSETAAINLCLQSATFATTWATVNASVPTTAVLCPDGITRTTCTLKEDATAATQHYIKQNITGTTLIASVYAKAVYRSFMYFALADGAKGAFFNLGTGAVSDIAVGVTAGSIDVGNGWYRCWIYATQTSGNFICIGAGESAGDWTFSGADRDSLYIFGAQIETGNYPSSYIPTTTVAVTRTADLLRYKAAETRTNLCLQSQTFNTTWTPINSSIATTNVVCPNGQILNTCTLHEDSTSSVYHYIQITPAQSSTLQYVYSCYVKAANRSWVGLYTANTAYKAFFDVTNGVLGTGQTNLGSGMINVGNGWWRCWMTFMGSATTYVYIFAATGGGTGDNITFNGLNQDSLYIYGAQFETGSYPTNYIPTTTVAVSLVEPMNMAQGQGSMECNVLLSNIDQLLSPSYWYISDGTANNIIATTTGAAADVASVVIVNNTTAQANVATTTDVWNGSLNKLRAIWGYNDARIQVNGVQEGTPDTSVTVPTGLSQLDVGAYLSAGYELNGIISKIKISK